MKWPFNRSVVLVSDDVRLLDLVTTELQEMGCLVFRARDLAEVGDLVRAGLTKRFVLLRLGAELIPEAQLRRALADRTPASPLDEHECDGAAGADVPPERHLIN